MGRSRFGAALLGAALALAAPGVAPAAGGLSDLLVEKGVITRAEADGLGDVNHGTAFGLATADGRFSLAVYGYGQTRYTLTDVDGGTNTSNFSVQRARLGFKGHAFGPDLSYQLYLNVYSGKADASASLFDLYADYAASPHLALKAGQFKVPYGVQWNVSAARLQFVERGAVDGYFRLDRDTGLSAHGRVGDGLAYDLGLFNGEGTNQSNPDTHHLWVARLMATPRGPFAPHEADTDRSGAWRVLLVAGAAHDDHVAAHSITALGSRLTALGPSDLTTWNLFAGVRRGGGEARAEYHRRLLDPAGGGARTETAEGLSVQGGWFVSRNVEAALRYEHLDPNTHAGGDLTREAGVAVSRYFAGHLSKLQADLFRVNTQTGPGADTDDTRLRVQYQIAF